MSPRTCQTDPRLLADQMFPGTVRKMQSRSSNPTHCVLIVSRTVDGQAVPISKVVTDVYSGNRAPDDFEVLIEEFPPNRGKPNLSLPCETAHAQSSGFSAHALHDQAQSPSSMYAMAHASHGHEHTLAMPSASRRRWVR